LLKNARFDYYHFLFSDFISIDSSSTVQFNTVKFHPYLAYQTSEDTIYKLKVQTPQQHKIISSLPDGLFTNFQGMELKVPLPINSILNTIKTNQIH
jgi:hypothetical protein